MRSGLWWLALQAGTVSTVCALWSKLLSLFSHGFYFHEILLCAASWTSSLDLVGSCVIISLMWWWCTKFCTFAALFYSLARHRRSLRNTWSVFVFQIPRRLWTNGRPKPESSTMSITWNVSSVPARGRLHARIQMCHFLWWIYLPSRAVTWLRMQLFSIYVLWIVISGCNCYRHSKSLSVRLSRNSNNQN